MTKDKIIRTLSNIIQDGIVCGDEVTAIQESIEFVKSISNKKSRVRFSNDEIYCSGCGKRLPNGEYLFCPFCGTEFPRKISDEIIIHGFLENSDVKDICRYCLYNIDCGRGVKGGPNGPIYPPCADRDYELYLDIESIIQDMREKGME